MTAWMVATVVAAMLATTLVGRRSAAARDRLQRSLVSATRSPPVDSPSGQVGSSPTATVGAAPRPARVVLRWAVALGMPIAGFVALGGAVGGLVGLVAGAAVVIVPRQPSRPSVDADQVPVVVDLLAGCLAAGAGMAEALDAASLAADEELRSACRSVAQALRAGAPAEEAWAHWREDPVLEATARTAMRTSSSGAAAAEDLRRTAARMRAKRRASAQHRVRRASVWLVVPLGLCFLPAFVLLAVVPLVIGLLPSLR